MTSGNQARERLRGIAFMVAAVFVFAIMDSLMKRLSAAYAPFQVASLRCAASMLFLLLSILWRRSWRSLRPSNVTLHLLRGVLGISMLWGFVYAVRRLSLAETYAMFLCAPLLMTALSVPIQGERVPLRRWLAILIGLCGVLVILHPFDAPVVSLAAAAAAGLSTVSYALSALTVRSLGRRNSNTSLVFWYLLCVGIGSAVLAMGNWRGLLRADLGWLAAIGVSGALGQFWLTEAFRRAPPSVVGPFEYTAILWAFAIDWIFWSASPSRALLIGAGIVIASGVFVIWDESRHAQLPMTPANPPP